MASVGGASALMGVVPGVFAEAVVPITRSYVSRSFGSRDESVFGSILQCLFNNYGFGVFCQDI